MPEKLWLCPCPRKLQSEPPSAFNPSALGLKTTDTPLTHGGEAPYPPGDVYLANG